MHLFGKLTGNINNNMSLDGIRLNVFGDVPSQTTYMALDPVSQSVGEALRVLMPIVTTFGFLFADPTEDNGNGFSFLGDNFSRRSRVTFETGRE